MENKKLDKLIESGETGLKKLEKEFPEDYSLDEIIEMMR